MLGRDGRRIAQAEFIGVEQGGGGEAALDLVRHQHHLPPLAAQPAGEMPVHGRQAGTGIDDEQHEIRLLHRRGDPRGHARGEAFGRGFLQAGGIDQFDQPATQHGLGLLAVAGDAGGVGDQGHAPAREPVEQRGLADIRPARDDDDGRHGGIPSVGGPGSRPGSRTWWAECV